MQLKTLQIVWHGKEPVLSVDFQPNSHTLVSGGQDGEVKHWEVVAEDDGSPGVRFLSSYPVNSKAVNCVRFSPAGDMLASAGDKGEVLLWRFAAFVAGVQQQPQRSQLDGGEGGAAAIGSAASGMWRQVGLLRGHCDDVLDLAWAPDGSALLSGGIENNCILWDVEGRKSLKWLQDHGHYVQGVAWDPLGHYIASQSADRTARVYAVKPPPSLVAMEGGPKRAAAAVAAASVVTSASLARDGFYAAATLSKGPLIVVPQQPQQPQQLAAVAGAGGGLSVGRAQGEAAAVTAAGAPTAGGISKQPLFWDDSLPTFFRRLAWSPDGAFLAAPAGVFRATTSAVVTSTTHVFSRGDWSAPAISLPCLSKGALVVRFCPRLFRAPQPSAAAATASELPYRIVMAVASVDSVLIYDMQALEPLAVLGGIHFAAVTDLAWSDDGRYLVVASRDGYCTVCSFDEGELGEPVPLGDLPPGVAAAVSRAAARRHQERTAVAAAAAAAAKSAAVTAAATAAAAAAAAAAATAAAAPGDWTEGNVLGATTSGGGPEAPPGAAAPRRIQPIAVSSAATGSNLSQSRTGAAAAAGAKRPAEAEFADAGAASYRPKPKRIQPIPLSATALSAAAPAAADGAAKAGGGVNAAPATVAAAVAPPTVTNPSAAAPSSPGRRRIVPTRVDGPTGAGQSVRAAAATATAAVATVNATVAGGLSPLQSAASVEMAAAPSCTPRTCGRGVVLPGVAAPGSAAKMPTPQVLVFGTPPSSAVRGAGVGSYGAASEPRHGATAAARPVSSQPHAQPAKPKRVTPMPVDRGDRQILGAVALPPQPAVGLQPKPGGHDLASEQAPQQAQLACQAGLGVGATAGCDTAAVAAKAVSSGGVPAAVAAAPSVGAGSGGDGRGMSVEAPVGASSGSGAAPAGGGAGGGGNGPRLSIAQLAAMRGAVAARKAAQSEAP